MQQFIEKVQAMRQAQKAYFKMRNQGTQFMQAKRLNESKALEHEVDVMLEEMRTGAQTALPLNNEKPPHIGCNC